MDSDLGVLGILTRLNPRGVASLTVEIFAHMENNPKQSHSKLPKILRRGIGCGALSILQKFTGH
jgi:hypothetical protein